MAIEKGIFNQVLANPFDNERHTDELSTFVRDYPYCTPAIIALLKMKKETD